MTTQAKIFTASLYEPSVLLGCIGYMLALALYASFLYSVSCNAMHLLYFFIVTSLGLCTLNYD